MFQYCIGKILADRTGQEYRPPKRWLNKRGRPVAWTDNQFIVMEPTKGFHATGEPQVISASHWLDMDSIDPTRPIYIRYGYFQRYELLKPYKDHIRNDWLNIREPWMQDHGNADGLFDHAVFVHVRRTDYVNRPPHMGHTIDEYADCLDEFPDATSIVLVTDAPRDPFLQEFHRFGKRLICPAKSWDMDFMLLASCRWMIMSQSTYSWWAGFLGRAEKIVCPMREGTFWNYGIGLTGPASPDYPNLYVDDEPERWKWIT